MQLFSSALLTFRCMQVIVAVLANISESVLSWEKHASQPVYHLSTTTFERWMWPTWIYGAFRSWKAGWGLFKLVFVQWLYYNPIDASSNFLSLRSWELSNFDISPFPAPVKLSSIKIEEFLKAWQFQGFLDSTGKKVHHQPNVNELLRPKYLPIWGHRRPGTKHWHNRYRFNVHWTMDNPLGLHESSRSNIPPIQ